ncbi:MAG: hypothetical protein V7K67_15680 [Nostoc sp.]|uniref:hypothetical protein n=1 Tax=Nostoc sp. TaxID=1180 RepID=UPI002FF36195
MLTNIRLISVQEYHQEAIMNKMPFTVLLAIVAYCGDRGDITNRLHITLSICGIKC